MWFPFHQERPTRSIYVIRSYVMLNDIRKDKAGKEGGEWWIRRASQEAKRSFSEQRYT